jgi:hypothetical protein
LNLALVYAIGKVQENQVGLNLSSTHKMQVYADDVNLLRDNTDTIKEAEKTECMILSCHQDAGQNHNLNIDNKSSESVAQFRCLGVPVTNQNFKMSVYIMSIYNATDYFFFPLSLNTTCFGPIWPSSGV